MSFENEKDPANEPADQKSWEEWDRERRKKHTPAPWVLKPAGSIVAHPGSCVVKRESDFDWVATVQCSNVPEWHANGLLIAAAPELLEACCETAKELTHLATLYGNAPPMILPGILKQLNAAIAKAKGEP